MGESKILVRKIRLGDDKILLDLSKEYGLVLEGGGAKGSFQVGAWRALKEAGLKIKGVAGVSVGALNGALICMDDLEMAERIWENIDYSVVMELEDSFTGMVKRVVKDRGIDITPLKNLLHETIDEKRIRESSCELFASTFSITDKKLLNLDVKTLPEGEIENILMASSSLPVFKTEKLGGKYYTDGGGFNNVPLNVLVDRGYQDIIVIRIYGIGLDRERRVKIPEGTTVYHIAPLEELGGILEFEKKRSRKNMVLGYLEAKRLLYGLGGRRYYIYAPENETFYFNRMMQHTNLFIPYRELTSEWKGDEPPSQYRFYTEHLLPVLAKQLKLKEGWSYRDLYLMLLEDLALSHKIFRYRVYTNGELERELRKKMDKPD